MYLTYNMNEGEKRIVTTYDRPIFTGSFFFTLQGEKGAKGDPGPMGLPVRIFLSRLGS